MKSWKKFFAALGTFIGLIIILTCQLFASWAGVCFILWIAAKLIRVTFSLRVASGIWVLLIFAQKFIEAFVEKAKT